MKRSDLIIPISVVVHLGIINTVLINMNPVGYFGLKSLIAINSFWLLICFFMEFYPTTRKERFFNNFHRFVQVFLLFCLGYFTVMAFKSYTFNRYEQLYILSALFCALLLYRIIFFYLRNSYRIIGGNSSLVVVIGRDNNLKRLKQIFQQPELGYRYLGFFDNTFTNSKNYKGKVSEAYHYILENSVDEIYCYASQLTKLELHQIISFADKNFKKIKIIPDNKEVFTRAMDMEMFNNIPILNLRKSPLETNYALYGKRIFDLLFSSLVIVFVLSWLIPLMAILIKRESKGPVFFKQKRHGINKEIFHCLKFRSMAVNQDSDRLMASKNDMRVTRIGQFLRKTSIDELPQFLNVFMGCMSVVGPRPHMEAHTFQYESSVDKYLVRHYAKPGITGLAQVRGYRGEILEDRDIINRTRLDIFYLEKWSPLLDLKIIYNTVTNAISGEERAY